ncbi:pentatricopeptide repeat-containing protein At2g13600-like [Selaginella moellendorffii]|uniref:pentatricopeptide repeat-containing protein At2g13600-like n=1 Tax=Selaginella moellendorffii TaxID=88036 RepID=UPI000D1CDCD7|nr:pentatricopeptide repeat-containing protein At2g13600-like [Selaginella moellendorffii]|eukprot:XP_024517201.1 pentatricopeptide repeat-containing protein At2g13600-like [Selaginella moellendorffii]
MILGYVRNDRSSLALEHFARMRGSACEPDGRSFVAGLAACSSLATKEQGELIDGKLVKLESLARGMALYSDAAKKDCHTEIFVANSMLDLCGKCGSLVDARKIFDNMDCHDVVSWTSLILVYAENCEEEIALELIELMECSGCSPNSRTFVAGLMACSSLAVKDHGRLLKVRCLEKGRDLHRRAVESGCGGDVFVASALIDMYSRCGSLVDAENAFATITPSRDGVPWNALIHGCVLNGKSELALEKFQRMKATGCAPNDRTYIAVLVACSSLATASKEEEDGRGFSKARCLEKGLAIHAEAAKSQLDSDAYVASALVEMYARSGSMEDALAVFRKMVPCPSVTAWNSMILGYVASGESDVALKFFASMDERPDSQSVCRA